MNRKTNDGATTRKNRNDELYNTIKAMAGAPENRILGVFASRSGLRLPTIQEMVEELIYYERVERVPNDDGVNTLRIVEWVKEDDEK